MGKPDRGFTLVEIMAVMVILAALAAMAVPRVMASSDMARRNADMATARQIKSALDRYQVENGVYPKLDTDMRASNGAVTAAGFIPKYISKLDASTTQQIGGTLSPGFEVANLPSDWNSYTPQHVIAIFLKADGSAGEVRAYDTSGALLWTSAE